MIEIVFFYPNSDGQGSWCFSLLPSIELHCIHYDDTNSEKAILVSWLFWGFSIIKKYSV